MRSWKILSTFALAGALAASPAYAHGPSAAASSLYDQLPQPYGDALMTSDMREVNGCCTSDQSAMETTEGASIEGTVAAIDRESGQFVLETDEGLVSLVTWPDELIPVNVGDAVRVSLLQDEG
jgi:hypothetical protein